MQVDGHPVCAAQRGSDRCAYVAVHDVDRISPRFALAARPLPLLGHQAAHRAINPRFDQASKRTIAGEPVRAAGVGRSSTAAVVRVNGSWRLGSSETPRATYATVSSHVAPLRSQAGPPLTLDDWPLNATEYADQSPQTGFVVPMLFSNVYVSVLLPLQENSPRIR